MNGRAVVLDTNVAVVANEGHAGASEACVAICVNTIRDLVRAGQIAIDSEWRIIREYRANLSEQGQPGVGDIFLKWLLQNHQNPHRCVKAILTARNEAAQDFVEFPNDPGLAGFDAADRKFVAVANALPRKPTILQAVDHRWRTFDAAFRRAGIAVLFLC